MGAFEPAVFCAEVEDTCGFQNLMRDQLGQVAKMLEVIIAEELNTLDVAVLVWEKWNELLPPVLVVSSQEEEYLLEIVRLKQDMALFDTADG